MHFLHAQCIYHHNTFEVTLHLAGKFVVHALTSSFKCGDLVRVFYKFALKNVLKNFRRVLL